MRPALIAVLALLAFPTPGIAQDLLIGRASVIDAEAIEIRGQRQRLIGIDAVEAAQTCRKGQNLWPCGRRAANALAGFIGRSNVTCAPVGQVSFGRTLADCHVRGREIQQWLITEGWAVLYRTDGKAWAVELANAIAANRGIHAGEFIAPQDWRAGKRWN